MKTKQWLLLLTILPLALGLAQGFTIGGPAAAQAAQQKNQTTKNQAAKNQSAKTQSGKAASKEGAAAKSNTPQARADQLYQQKKYAEAAAILVPLAQKGDAGAAFSLGLMEARGDLGTPDYVKARSWWETAAKSGHPEAEYNLGLVYYRGVHEGGDGSDFSKRDYATAQKWLEKAAEHGHGGAMYALAGMARTGEGQPKNLEKAAQWYRRASEIGHPEAQYQLAGMYLNGAGVKADQAEAKKWMKKAADVGHPGAIQAMRLFKK